MSRGLLAALLLGLSHEAAAQAGPAIEGVRTATAGFAGMAARGGARAPVLIESGERFTAVFGDFDGGLANPYLAPSVLAFFANGGSRCYVVRVTSNDDSAYIAGLDALRAIDEVAVVCIPGVASPRVQTAMISHCEELRDRFAILDPPAGADLDALFAQRRGLRSDEGFAALYYPWLVADSPGGGRLPLPPSGFAAGLYARTDARQGVWKAPAGAVSGAADVARQLTDLELGSLNGAGISAIRSIAGRGLQVWGARTLSGDPEWQYVSVRRFLIYIEESISEGIQWAVFEPSDEPLWARLRAAIGDFLTVLWRSGAFPGAVPQEAFFVRADRSTMTQEDIDRGRTVILVGAAPLRPAEFTILRIAIERTAPGPRFLRGDSTGDGLVDVSDPVRSLGFLFLGEDPPPCLDAADAADDGEITIASAVYVLEFLFLGGPPMQAPFPGCGEDPTADPLAACADPAGACP